MMLKFEADIICTIGKITENGNLHKVIKQVNWCYVCGSAFAEAEVEYHDKKSIAIYVNFAFSQTTELLKIFNVSGDYSNTPVSIVIWTTTPWTIPANEGVSVHPTLEYSLVLLKEQNEIVLLATDLVNDAMGRYGID